MSNAQKVIRIGCSSGFWGDSPSAAWQLVTMGGHLDYLVADYLAEVTMGILAKRKGSGQSRGGSGEGGYIAEFVKMVWQPLMKEIIAKKIKIITNAGGMNPHGLKAAIEQAAKDAGVQVPIVAAVIGDDITDHAIEWRTDKTLQPFILEGEAEVIPETKIESLNAYLGAEPIAAALAQGAQIIVTGRCVDSALAAGALMHEFGWKAPQYDLLASAALAGHIIECGCQATGGNYTDWEESYAAGWTNVGFPIVECFADGRFVVTKPDNTGGVVTRGTVAEQMLYEIGDPAAYILPDVVCDWRAVRISELPNRPNAVLVEGARGRPPPATYKVSGTYYDGFKLSVELLIGGADAARKAQAVGESVFTRVGFILARRKLPPLTETNIELLGAEHTYGPHSRAKDVREVILRLSASSSSINSLAMFGMELAPTALSMAPGITGGGSGRVAPMAVIKHFACLVPKSKLSPAILVGNSTNAQRITIAESAPSLVPPLALPAERPIADESLNSSIPKKKVALVELCYGRSGDKGDASNIGIFARHERYYPFLARVLTEEAVRKYMEHLVKGKVTRFAVPGIRGFNFVLTRALGGGGLASLNIDRQGKTYAQMLLQMEVEVPSSWGRAKASL